MNPKPRICRSRSFLKTLYMAPPLAVHHDSCPPRAPRNGIGHSDPASMTPPHIFPSLRGLLSIGVTQHIRCERVKGCGAKTMCCRRAVVLDGWVHEGNVAFAVITRISDLLFWTDITVKEIIWRGDADQSNSDLI